MRKISSANFTGGMFRDVEDTRKIKEVKAGLKRKVRRVKKGVLTPMGYARKNKKV